MIVKKLMMLGIVVIMISFFIDILPRKQTENIPTSHHKGYTYAKVLSDKKVSEIEMKIRKIKRQDEQMKRKEQSYAVRFENAVIMGDSLSQAFLDYRLLNTNEVLAYRGRRVDNINEDIEKAIRLAPDIIFMGYGMNDLEYVRGNAQLFVETYKKQIQKLKKALPTSKIYIHSIIPMDERAIAKKPVYQSYVSFNKALQQMCKEEYITYIDNGELMDWNASIYEQDGVHPLYPYYPIWLQHMAEIAGI